MPLVKVHLRTGSSETHKAAIAEAIQSALVESLGVPGDDRFLLITEYADENFRHTSSFVGVDYSRDLLIVEIILIEGRSVELRKAFLLALNASLVNVAGVRPEDVMVVMQETGAANFSFGHGLTQRAP